MSRRGLLMWLVIALSIFFTSFIIAGVAPGTTLMP